MDVINAANLNGNDQVSNGKANRNVTKSPEYSREDQIMLAKLLKSKPQAQFSSHLLYDAKGSDLYEKITTTPEYYIARAEMEVIKQHLSNFAPWTEDERHVLVELGAGVGEKTHNLLPVLKKAAPSGFLYAPLDFDGWALKQNKQRLQALHPSIKCETLQGLFEEALPGALALEGRKTILFQGSTFGNFKSYEEAVEFVKLVGSLMSKGDRFVLGVDSAPIPGKKSVDYVHDCYRKNTNGWREEFMLNGMDHANRRCGLDLDRSQWLRVTEWDEEQLAVFHYYEAQEPVVVRTVEGALVREFAKGERILVQTHFKYTQEKLARLAQDAGMVMSRSYMADSEHFIWAEFTLDAGKDDSKMKEVKPVVEEHVADEEEGVAAKESMAKDRALVVSMLKQSKFHTMFFYDAKGSQLYENITKQPEYYLTKTETALIEARAHEIAPWGTTRHIMVELGAGVGEKTHRLLPAMKAGSPDGQFLYAPIDCDGWCLEQNRDRLKELHPEIECSIQVGFYEDRLKVVQQMEGQKTILFLGSTICNFNTKEDSINFVKMIRSRMCPGDRLIIGVDTPPKEGKKTVDFVHDAYRKSTGGHREEFIMNGLDHANRRAGVDFVRAQWKRVTEWNAEESAVLHFVESLQDQDIHAVPEGDVLASFKKGHRVLVSTHGKYSPEKLTSIVEAAGLQVSRSWMPENEHWLWQESVIKADA